MCNCVSKCSGGCSNSRNSDTVFRILNPGILDCSTFHTLQSVNHTGSVTWTSALVTPVVGFSVVAPGVMVIPAGYTGSLRIKGVDSAGNVAYMVFDVFCPPALCADPCIINKQTCSITARLNGCAPFTIIDANGRTQVITNAKDYHFLTFGN
jgi:hypothetical protein